MAVERNATSFTEICQDLPRAFGYLSGISTVIWGVVFMLLYTQFLSDSVQAQITAAFNQSNAQGKDPILFLVVFAFVLAVTSPTTFGGRLGVFLNNLNLAASWSVTVTAIVRGMLIIREGMPYTREYSAVIPSGLPKISVLLSANMCTCVAMPQLVFEIVPEQRKRAAVLVPAVVAFAQALILGVAGLAGYFALGNQVRSNVFDCYPNDAYKIVMQVGLVIMMYLSMPLMLLPAKAQVYAALAAIRGEDTSRGLSNASTAMKQGINIGIVASTTVVSFLLPTDRVLKVVEIALGFAGVWLNYWLPSLLLLIRKVRPAIQNQHFPFSEVGACAWLFLVALACTTSSLMQMLHSFRWG